MALPASIIKKNPINFEDVFKWMVDLYDQKNQVIYNCNTSCTDRGGTEALRATDIAASQGADASCTAKGVMLFAVMVVLRHRVGFLDTYTEEELRFVERWMSENPLERDILNKDLQGVLECTRAAWLTEHGPRGSPSSCGIPVPWLSSAVFVCSHVLYVVVELVTVNLSLITECCGVSLEYLKIANEGASTRISRVITWLQWLLNDSKLGNRSKDNASTDILVESVYTLGSALDVGDTALTAGKSDLQHLVTQGVTKGRKRYLLNSSRMHWKSLVAAFHEIGKESCDRVQKLLLPTMTKRVSSGISQKRRCWPEDTPVSIDASCFPSETGLDWKAVDIMQREVHGLQMKLQGDISITTTTTMNSHTEAEELSCLLDVVVDAVTLEFLAGLFIVEDMRIEYFNCAVDRVTKGKKATSVYPPIGHPLKTLVQGISETSFQLFRCEHLLCPWAHLRGLKLLRYKERLDKGLTCENQVGRRPKIAKGCIDIVPTQMLKRDTVLHKIKQVFRQYGVPPIDTPVFELKETLLGKYGEDEKLIFNLQDQGGEQLSLRYDLTIPFARYVATHSVEKMKRYQIGKVYRRDEPQVNHGRLREFYQCDMDIAGSFDTMVADAEALCAFIDIFKTFRQTIGDVKIKLSHRRLLNSILHVCGIESKQFKPVCSAIDKLDKCGWDVVQQELCDTKGVDVDCAHRLGQFVELQGAPQEMLDRLKSMEKLSQELDAQQALQEMQLLFSYLDEMNALWPIVVDLSLARGLDYYTGIIFEAVIPQHPWVGSIGAGGRYDNLLEQFCGKPIPAVGISIGIERLFRLIELNVETSSTPPNNLPVPMEQPKTRGNMCHLQSYVDVVVCSVGRNLTRHRMAICKQLRDAHIVADFCYTDAMKLGKQLQQANDLGVELVVILGEDELERECVKVKRLDYSATSVMANCTRARDAHSSQPKRTDTFEIEVNIRDLVSTVKQLLQNTHLDRRMETLFKTCDNRET